MNLHRYIPVLLLLTLSHFCRAVNGDGNVIAEKRIVHQFSHLTINGPFKIITSNDPHSDFFIKIETDKNLQEYVTVSETGAYVFVNIKPGVDIKRFTKLVLYIDTRSIQSLTINANTNEHSDILLPVICHNSQLRINGSIPISVRVMVTCHHVSHLKDSTGILDPNAINYVRLAAQINNTRSTTITGDIEEAVIINDGTGEINATDLKVDLLRVRNNNVASIEVYSDHDLKVNNTASGYVYYSGSGTITELKQAGQGIVCRDASLITDISPSSHVEVSPQIKSIRDIGFDTDSLFGAMMVRDQRHRQGKPGDTMHTAKDDAENFACLRWYLTRYGYPEFRADSLEGMCAAIFMHIDNYANFMQVKDELLKAVKEGKMLPNTYAYAYDRSLIAGHKDPIFYYFVPGYEWDMMLKPAKEDIPLVNKQRKQIGLPDYPLLLNGKYF